MQSIDVSGQRFTRLVAVRALKQAGSRRLRWECLCDCGKLAFPTATQLRTGHSKSCGCLSADAARSRVTTHGLSKSREFNVWQCMIRRCENPKQDDYPRYGGRGISVCPEWRESFVTFLLDMGPRPSPKHSIERMDNNGNYEPGNCRWATNTEQCRNHRRNRLLTANGVTKPLVCWVESTGLHVSTILRRLNNGWPEDVAVTRHQHNGKSEAPMDKRRTFEAGAIEI